MNMTKVGPAGGYGGTIWDDKGRDKVAGIVVIYNKLRVFALQFLFYENGNLVRSDKHGTQRRGNIFSVVFDYSSEFLTSISGYFKTLTEYTDNADYTFLGSIRFGTNKGSYGPFGCARPSTDDEIEFDFQLGNHHLFGGFYGTENHCGIESIGVHVKPIPSSSMINFKNLRVKDEKEDD
ncbi:inactive protein RESTRICTED TEV MOVEMENT 1-like [Lycium barbarum]|uniref:inactive protein RESTRICTED TEV MOVEMENT 1-like n=1 Tax=Lycium barbarum TaxID=112863 RepID=UPI00293F0166|nr:inactive protein RESTRICTED TEV MOVEMENT 1-like [Lycium barbarum]XP_060178874.1 inactive protein RESTRICTED TEV MOVEMENT 1-like [Lycium barbarum]